MMLNALATDRPAGPFPPRLCAAAFALTVLLASGCTGYPTRNDEAKPDPDASTQADEAKPKGPPALSLAESWPLETTLDHADIADAKEVWVALIDEAEQSLDFGEFYAAWNADSAIVPVVEAIERAAARGVKVRFIVDTKLLDGNTEIPERLEQQANIELRRYDLGALMGGVQHAKYFVVDGRVAYLGSQNFDWRSLEHVQEFGVTLREPALVAPLAATFAIDWALAGGADPATVSLAAQSFAMPVLVDYDGEATEVQTVLSPKDWLPDAAAWDLPKILALIDNAKTRIRVQLLDYATKNYDKTSFTELDDALRRAAARGVSVEIMVSDWCKRPKNLPALTELQQLDNIAVRLVTIPQHSGGFVPHARVVHSKYMTVDGESAWIGTSNWSGDYFYQSRNVGIIAKGARLTAAVDAFFDTLWGSGYAYELDPAANYEPPKIK